MSAATKRREAKAETATKPRGKPPGSKCKRRPWLPCPACGKQFSEVVRTMVRVGDRQRRCMDPECGELWITTEANRRNDTGVISEQLSVTRIREAQKYSPPK